MLRSLVGSEMCIRDSVYMAMSNIDRAMTDGQGDIDVSDNFCGIVYRMPVLEDWDINRIDPVIIGGPYTSSAQYECNNNNLAGPDNILVLNDGSILVGEDTRKHEYNTVWLWREYIAPVIEVDEEIQVNHLRTSNTPTDLNAPWTYEYQAEVVDLAQDTTYTAIVVAKNLSSGEWSGIWWWEDIQSNGQQYDLAIALNRGCYSIDTTLYEQQELRADPSNAIGLSSNQTELVVGNGTCLDGEYTETVQNEVGQGDGSGDESEATPGFGIVSALLALCISMIVASRKQ